ncbi:MAG: patatin-like phospholipase family protein [Rhizobiales bacterium]|nr:patatin-like phospholipase family protein [Hyphomicrobiales bacterium]
MPGYFLFHQVYEREIEAINERRDELRRASVDLTSAGRDREGHPIRRPADNSKLVGLALSGGGVRSASFCLGVMQALDENGSMKKVDYLSTVSGGGYIGTSMTAAMSESVAHRFPFPSELRADEVPGIQHIRDHSNYLFPRGKADVFSNLAIYLRGLVANVILILPFLLFAAALTIVINPAAGDLMKPAFIKRWAIVDVNHFGITLHVMMLIVVLLALWALWRSIIGQYRDVATGWTFVSRVALLAVIFSAFCEFQPVALEGMFKLAVQEKGELAASVIEFFKFLSAILAAFSTAVGFLAPFLGKLLKQGAENPAWTARLGRIAAKVAIYIAAAAVPLVLWIVYLYLSFWGICSPDCNALIAERYWAPKWILDWAALVFGAGGIPVYLYVAVAVIMFGASLLLSPNSNSLHSLYRDRLSKAFIFNPDERAVSLFSRIVRWFDGVNNEIVRRARDLKPLDKLKLSKINVKFAPYQIINTALNIRGSKYANQRGRNADFFVFTPKFVGSHATNYVPTEQMEARVRNLDLAAAMAISGAAASSNMGANTIKALSPTLAILNVRLGFWLLNPLRVAARGVVSGLITFLLSLVDQFYFLWEIIGRLREDRSFIYLTDGGHIENLGIYELLRRRCQLIIAVDAEADPQMSFNSFVALQRYALIDLGVLVHLPWAYIRDASRAATEKIAKTGGEPPLSAPHGPHCALGSIDYPGGGKGVLLYIKSSMTGDENDYIVDYKRRYSDFPHETTADQLFSEEQFEVYRALGFHATRRALNGRDKVAMAGGPKAWRGRVLGDRLVRIARSML